MHASLNRMVVAMAVAALLWCVSGISVVAAEKYLVYLSPMPFSEATHPNMTGKGTGSATLDGDALTVNGVFSGLASAATKGHLSLSKAAGIPGTALFDLTVSRDVTGKVTGQLKLNSSQVAALRGERLYIQIDSEKAPMGNLWGWLLPDHEIAGQDVPQKGPWFVPPFAVKTK